jgi:hypothetical protein
MRLSLRMPRLRAISGRRGSFAPPFIGGAKLRLRQCSGSSGITLLIEYLLNDSDKGK